MTEAFKTIVAAQLDRPVPPEARDLANALAEESGSAVLAILFYGSCLRNQTAEGVLDFYILLDNYSDYHTSALALWQTQCCRLLYNTDRARMRAQRLP